MSPDVCFIVMVTDSPVATSKSQKLAYLAFVIVPVTCSWAPLPLLLLGLLGTTVGLLATPPCPAPYSRCAPRISSLAGFRLQRLYAGHIKAVAWRICTSPMACPGPGRAAPSGD